MTTGRLVPPTTRWPSHLPADFKTMTRLLSLHLVFCLCSLASQAQPLPGQIDPSFDPGEGPNGAVLQILEQPDGKILISGEFTQINGISRPGIARLEADGSVDIGFDAGSGPRLVSPGWFSGFFLAQQSDGKILMGGPFNEFNGLPANGLVRLNADGSVDPAFNPPPGVFGIAGLLPDGRIITRMPVMRLKPDGGMDPSFISPPEFATVPTPWGAIEFHGATAAMGRPDGTILVVAGFVEREQWTTDYTQLFRLQANGSIDPGFSPRQARWQDGFAMSATDGRIYGWNQSGNQGADLNRLFRYLPSGELDAAFEIPELRGWTDFPPVALLVVEPSGRIVVGGSFFSLNGASNLGRLDPSGRLDPAFDPPADYQAYVSTISALAAQSDGHLIVARRNWEGTQFDLARLFGGSSSFEPQITDQSLETISAMEGQRVALWVTAVGTSPLDYQWMLDGEEIAGATTSVLLLEEVKLSDAGLYSVRVRNASGSVQGGEIVLSVEAATLPTISRHPASQVTIEGRAVVFSVEATHELPLSYQWEFNQTILEGETSPELHLPQARMVDQGGYTVVVHTETGSVRSGVATLEVLPPPTRAGAIDLSFFPPPLLPPGRSASGLPPKNNSLALQPDEKILTVSSNQIVRLHQDGGLDQGFSSEGVVSGSFSDPAGGAGLQDISSLDCLHLQRNGKLLIGGRFNKAGPLIRRNIARLEADGTVDPTFAPAGHDWASGIFPSASGRILVLLEEHDGKILAGGLINEVRLNTERLERHGLFRMHSDGSLDAAYGPGTGPAGPLGNHFLYVMINTLVPAPDDGVLVTGNFFEFDNLPRPEVALLTGNGRVNTGFNSSAAVNLPARNFPAGPAAIFGALLQQDGKAVIFGAFTNVWGEPVHHIARLHANGALDGSFDPGTSLDAPVLAAALQPDGRIIIGGGFSSFGGIPRAGVARLNPDGSLDEKFDPGSGMNSEVFALALQPDGNVIVRGHFTMVDGVAREGIARLHGRNPIIPQLLTGVALPDKRILLRFQTFTGRTYSIEQKAMIGDPSWRGVALVQGDGTVQTYTEAMHSAATRFYRVRVEED
jgi:uncharacterized delta-60 repeat protein